MGGAGAEAGHHLVPLSNLLLDDVAGVGVGGMKLVECPQVALAAGLFAGYQVMVDEVGSEHFLYGVQVALSVGFQKAADQGLVLLYRHTSLLLANLTSSFGSATTSMMPPGEVRRIDRMLIHPSVWMVNSLEVRFTAYYCGTTATASISTKTSGCARAETNTPVIAGGLGVWGQAFWNAAKPACSDCPW